MEMTTAAATQPKANPAMHADEDIEAFETVTNVVSVEKARGLAVLGANATRADSKN